jgi:hypothetical protein
MRPSQRHRFTLQLVCYSCTYNVEQTKYIMMILQGLKNVISAFQKSCSIIKTSHEERHRIVHASISNPFRLYYRVIHIEPARLNKLLLHAHICNRVSTFVENFRTVSCTFRINKNSQSGKNQYRSEKIL